LGGQEDAETCAYFRDIIGIEEKRMTGESIN
jgi:hypothetical protein